MPAHEPAAGGGARVPGRSLQQGGNRSAEWRGGRRSVIHLETRARASETPTRDSTGDRKHMLFRSYHPILRDSPNGFPGPGPGGCAALKPHTLEVAQMRSIVAAIALSLPCAMNALAQETGMPSFDSPYRAFVQHEAGEIGRASC